MKKTQGERYLLRRACTAELPGFREASTADQLRQLADWCDSNEVEHDYYGTGKSIALLENKVAELLGKPGAVYMPSGVMAQLIALRLHTEAQGIPRFGMHITSHLEQYEEKAYQAVFGLHGVLVGDPFRPITSEHLARVPETLSALIVELPMREIGGQLPSLKELDALKLASKERGVLLHLDGARLWECRAFYQRSYAQICAGFESVYVSLYKGIGALAGAVLAGESDFIAAARVWRRRMGGTIIKQTPMVASALMQLDLRLAQMEHYYQRTLSLAAMLNRVDGIRTIPLVPQTNMLHLVFDAPPEALLEARDAIAEERRLWLVGYARETEVPGTSRTEIYIGDHALDVSNEVLADAFTSLMTVARAASASA
jgi:threonine aldolase